MEQVAVILQRAGLYFTDLVQTSYLKCRIQETLKVRTKQMGSAEKHTRKQRKTILSWLPLHTKGGDFEQEVNIRDFESTPGEALPPFSSTAITLDDSPSQEKFVIILTVIPTHHPSRCTLAIFTWTPPKCTSSLLNILFPRNLHTLYMPSATVSPPQKGGVVLDHNISCISNGTTYQHQPFHTNYLDSLLFLLFPESPFRLSPHCIKLALISRHTSLAYSPFNCC